MNKDKMTFEKAETSMKGWKNIHRKKTNKYIDEPGATDEKKIHQHAYICDLVRDVNIHNYLCDDAHKWHIHSWYDRWVFGNSGKYFITVAIVREGRTGRTRTYLGDTMISRKPFRKDLLLEKLRDFTNSNILEVIKKNSDEFLRPALEQLRSMIKNNHKIKAILDTSANLIGLCYADVDMFMSRLMSWLSRLDKKKTLLDDNYTNWTDYFLRSNCDTKKFCQGNCGYAPNGCFGRFRKPIHILKK